MPTVDNLTIIYDALNEYETFSPGDTITGKVVLVLSKDTKAQSLYIKAKGDANVRWTRKSGDKTHTYHAHRRYFKLKQFLIPESSAETDISRGSHVYPFRFTIPSQEMPPSFKAAHGSIIYRLDAVLSRSWRMDHNESKELKFASKFVSNLQSLMAPQVGSTKKEMGLFSKGHVHMDVTINKRAYAPGETVVIAAKVNNSSSSDMTPKYSLTRSLVYRANASTKHERYVVHKIVDDKSIKPQTQTEVQCTMKIPDGEMPTIQNCEIISVEYEIKVYLDISFASDPEVVFPVVIIPPLLLSDHQSGGAVGPYPAGAIGGPSNSDFPPQAVGPYPSPFHQGLQSHPAPAPAYPPVMYPALPPHVAGGYNNPMPQQHGPYASPFSSSSSAAVLHPPPSVPTFHPPPSAPEIKPQLPPSYDMSTNAPPTHNLPPSAPMMNVDFLSQSDEAPPAYNFLFPPFAPENSNSK
ncbi:arrestin domain-containing protein 3-like [Solea solea]|uniref:arrestin domain-containing protein 3-like n=1 Tax=Solea solea TaxID=90069 RepID=UPI00272BDD24|nr:arrestin domain-containing protein 3-like [Solea solea]